MNRKTKHILAKIILIVLFLVLLVFFIAEYKTTYKITEVVSSSNNDYRLSIYMIGEPQFPYGYTKWGFSLYKGKKKITEESLSLLNDGKNLSKDNFTLKWTDSTLTIIASSSEEEDIKFVVSLLD